MSEPFSKRHEEKAIRIAERVVERPYNRGTVGKAAAEIASALAAAEQELVARMMDPTNRVLLEGQRPAREEGMFLTGESALTRWRAMLIAFCAENGIPIPETESTT